MESGGDKSLKADIGKEVPPILRDAAKMFEERYNVYGDNYKKVGVIMAALFPEGLTLKTPDDWNRMHVFLLSIVKRTRYVTNWDKGGHEDSVADDLVYDAMLLSIDRAVNAPEETKRGRTVEVVGVQEAEDEEEDSQTRTIAERFRPEHR